MHFVRGMLTDKSIDKIGLDGLIKLSQGNRVRDNYHIIQKKIPGE